jgi:hypothetical protein
MATRVALVASELLVVFVVELLALLWINDPLPVTLPVYVEAPEVYFHIRYFHDTSSQATSTKDISTILLRHVYEMLQNMHLGASCIMSHKVPVREMGILSSTEVFSMNLLVTRYFS